MDLTKYPLWRNLTENIRYGKWQLERVVNSLCFSHSFFCSMTCTQPNWIPTWECSAKRLYEGQLEAIYTNPFIRCAHTAELIALAYNSLVMCQRESWTKRTWTTDDNNNHYCRRHHQNNNASRKINQNRMRKRKPGDNKHLRWQWRRWLLLHSPTIIIIMKASTETTPAATITLNRKKTYNHVRQPWTNLLKLHDDNWIDFAIVCHAPCNQALVLHWLQRSKHAPVCQFG